MLEAGLGHGRLLLAVTIRDALTPYIDKNDEMLVVLFATRDVAWIGFNDVGSNWLKDAL